MTLKEIAAGIPNVTLCPRCTTQVLWRQFDPALPHIIDAIVNLDRLGALAGEPGDLDDLFLAVTIKNKLDAHASRLRDVTARCTPAKDLVDELVDDCGRLRDQVAATMRLPGALDLSLADARNQAPEHERDSDERVLVGLNTADVAAGDLLKLLVEQFAVGVRDDALAVLELPRYAAAYITDTHANLLRSPHAVIADATPEAVAVAAILWNPYDDGPTQTLEDALALAVAIDA